MRFNAYAKMPPALRKDPESSCSPMKRAKRPYIIVQLIISKSYEGMARITNSPRRTAGRALAGGAPGCPPRAIPDPAAPDNIELRVLRFLEHGDSGAWRLLVHESKEIDVKDPGPSRHAFRVPP